MNSQDDSLVYEAIEAGCYRLSMIHARLAPTEEDGILYERCSNALSRLKKAGRIQLVREPGGPRRWKTTKHVEQGS